MMETTLTPIQPKDTDKERCAALQEYFSSCSVIVTSETPGFNHGTGVAVKYGNEYYIISAAHVLRQEPANDKLLVIGKPNSSLKEVRKDELSEAFFAGTHGSIKYSTPSSVTIIGRLEDKRMGDITALKIRPTTDNLPHTDFHDLSNQGQTDISVGRPVVICGFPGALAQHAQHVVTGQQGALTTNYCVYQHIQPVPDLLRQLDPSIHFVTDFSGDTERCDPKGMSGGGAWSIPSFKKGELWSPGRTQLLGIQSEFAPRSNLLVLVRIERVLDLLSGN